MTITDFIQTLRHTYHIRKKGDEYEAIKEFHTSEEMTPFYYGHNDLKNKSQASAFRYGQPAVLVIVFTIDSFGGVQVRRLFAFNKKEGRKEKYYDETRVEHARWIAGLQLQKDAGVLLPTVIRDAEMRYNEIASFPIPYELHQHILIQEVCYEPFLKNTLPRFADILLLEYKHPKEYVGLSLFLLRNGNYRFGYTEKVFDNFPDAFSYLEYELKKKRLRLLLSSKTQ